MLTLEHDEKILQLVKQFREVLLQGIDNPKGYCYMLSDPLSLLLDITFEGMNSSLEFGYWGSKNIQNSHAWIKLNDGRVIDATISQFGDDLPEIYFSDPKEEHINDDSIDNGRDLLVGRYEYPVTSLPDGKPYPYSEELRIYFSAAIIIYTTAKGRKLPVNLIKRIEEYFVFIARIFWSDPAQKFKHAYDSIEGYPNLANYLRRVRIS